jgi:hypothetical protein
MWVGRHPRITCDFSTEALLGTVAPPRVPPPPFWFGFVGSAILVAGLWRQFDHIVHAGDPGPGATPAGTESGTAVTRPAG